MNSSRPAVSVVIPALNAERFIAAAVRSVLSELAEHDEVIVVDDGSTDSTGRAAQDVGDARVQVIHREHVGDGAATNAGIAVARGDVIAFCDADDLWASGRLNLQLAELAVAPGAVVIGAIRNFADGTDPEQSAEVQVAAGIRGTILMRRDTFNLVGPFNETMRSGAVVEWWTRAVGCGAPIRTVQGVVLHRRIHGNNIGVTRRADRDRELPGILRAHLERKRAAGGQTDAPR